MQDEKVEDINVILLENSGIWFIWRSRNHRLLENDNIKLVSWKYIRDLRRTSKLR